MLDMNVSCDMAVKSFTKIQIIYFSRKYSEGETVSLGMGISFIGYKVNVLFNIVISFVVEYPSTKGRVATLPP